MASRAKWTIFGMSINEAIKMNFTKQTIQNDHVLLDGNEFISCTFKNCNLEYRGYAGVGLAHCNFDGCNWSFGEPASNAIKFMAALYAQGGDARKLIERTFDTIKKDQAP